MLGQPGLDVLGLQVLIEIPAPAAKASSRDRVNRSNGSASLTIACISASIRGKSSSLIGVCEIEVVVEAVAGRRPECQADAVVQPHDGPGHHVGTRVPQDAEGFGIARGEQAEGQGIGGGQLFERTHGINDRIIDNGRNRGLGQTLADRPRDIECRSSRGILFNSAVRKLDVHEKSGRQPRSAVLGLWTPA